MGGRIMEGSMDRMAELSYSKAGQLELLVPYGTKFEEIARLRERLFTDLVARLPRGCPACISGESLLIRERFENVLRIDLDSLEILGP
jgi:hypothetical protein